MTLLRPDSIGTTEGSCLRSQLAKIGEYEMNKQKDGGEGA